jgi:hypothetical protein
MRPVIGLCVLLMAASLAMPAPVTERPASTGASTWSPLPEEAEDDGLEQAEARSSRDQRTLETCPAQRELDVLGGRLARAGVDLAHQLHHGG